MLTADRDKAPFASGASPPPTADALGLAEVPVPVGVPAVAFAVAYDMIGLGYECFHNETISLPGTPRKFCQQLDSQRTPFLVRSG